EHTRRATALQQPVEVHETAARGAVMAGAEGEASLDLDADVAQGHPVAIMRAVDEEAAGSDRLEPGERIGDPILLLGEAEFHPRSGVLASDGGNQFANARLVGREAEIDLHRPRLAAAGPRRLGLEGGGGGFRRLEAL